MREVLEREYLHISEFVDNLSSHGSFNSSIVTYYNTIPDGTSRRSQGPAQKAGICVPKAWRPALGPSVSVATLHLLLTS